MSFVIDTPKFKKAFISVDEFKKFVDKNVDDWQWLNSVSGGSFTGPAKSLINNNFRRMRDILDRYYARSDSDPQPVLEVCNALNEVVKSFYSGNGFFSSDRRFGFLKGFVEEKNDVVAAYIFSVWLNSNTQGADVGILAEAITYKILYESNIKGKERAERRQLELLLDETQKNLDAVVLVRDEITQSCRNFEVDYPKLLDGCKADFESSLNEKELEWQAQLTDVTEELNRLRATYDEHMKLASPVRYWESKRIKHQRISWVLGIVTLLAMLGTYRVLGNRLESFSGRFQDAASAVPPLGKAVSSAPLAVIKNTAVTQATSLGKALEAAGPIWHFDFAFMILMGTMCFWLLRIFVRLFLSQIHLENDAAERVTMAKTYIAMYRRRKLSEGDQDQLSLVLSALFRPSGDGIVKDEGVPPSFVDLLTKLK